MDGGLEVESGIVRLPSTNALDAQPVIDRIRKEGLVVTDLSLKSQSLEDLFIGLVGGTSSPPPLQANSAQPPKTPQA